MCKPKRNLRNTDVGCMEISNESQNDFVGNPELIRPINTGTELVETTCKINYSPQHDFFVNP